LKVNSFLKNWFITRIMESCQVP